MLEVRTWKILLIWTILVLMVGLVSVMVPVNPVRADTINVPGDYPTIQEAIDAASNGDTILVAAGTYDVPVFKEVNKSVTITGPAAGGAIVRGTNPVDVRIFKIIVSDVTLKNLEFTLESLDPHSGINEIDNALVGVSGTSLSGIIIENNILHVPLQAGLMSTWNARAITVNDNSCTGVIIRNNTISNVRNGIVVRNSNTATMVDNLVFNTKGGIMNYTSNQADADNRTITGNSWTSTIPGTISHNEWDIVWNTAYWVPNYQQSVVAVSAANNDAYVLDRRAADATACNNLTGNRSHIFVDASSSHNTAHPAKGNFNEPLSTINLGIDAVVPGGIVYVAAGTYNETITFGNVHSNLTIEGNIADRPVVNGGVKFTNTTPITGPTLQNLYFKGTARPSPNERIFWNANTAAINDFALDNCVLDGENTTGRMGIAGEKFGQSFSITNSEFKGLLHYNVMDIDPSTSGPPYGGSELPLTTVTFAGNNVHDCNGTIALRGNHLTRTTEVNVFDNSFTNIGDNQGQQGLQWAALELNHAETANVYSNVVDGLSMGQYGEGQAFQFWDIGTLNCNNNEIKNNYEGIFIFAGSSGGTYGGPYAAPGGSISNNNIFNNNQYGISMEAAATGGPVDAINNWWGSTNGSEHPGNTFNIGSQGDKVSGNINYVPWLDAAYPGGNSFAPVNNTTQGTGYSSIQAAIDAAVAGDTITAAAGTYSESVVINKTVTLLGAQADIDPRPSVGGRSGPESIIASNSTALSITAHNIVVNGFTFESNINNAALNVVQAVDAHNPQILYNIVYNTNPGGSSNEGIKIRRSYDTGGMVAYNYVYDIPNPGDAINFDSVNSGFISHNEVRNIGSENAAIYIYNSLNTTIEGNLVDTTTQNDGIKLGNKGGSDAGKSGGLIKDNIVCNTMQDGISVYMSNVIIDGNEVYNSASENGAIYIAYAVSDITIQYNKVHDNTFATGKWGNPAGIMIGTAADASTISVNYNYIYGNNPNGVTNKATAELNATSNWWGDDSGPTHADNPGGTGDTVSDNVAYVPWLLQKDDTTSATGTGTVTFETDFGGIIGLTAIAENTLPTAGKPWDAVFRHGLFSFNITGIIPGSTVNIIITYPSTLPAGIQYWKYQAGKGWYQIPIVNHTGNVIIIQLTDGGLGDSDGVADGIIVDPGGPAASSGTSGGGGGGYAPLAPSYPVTLTVNMQTSISTAMMTSNGVLGATLIASDTTGRHIFQIDKDSRITLADNRVPLLIRFRETSTKLPAPENAVIVGPVYEFNAYSSTSATTPSPVTISPPARLILTYNPNMLPENATEVMIAYYHTDQGWQDLGPAPGVVAEIGKAHGLVGHFSHFAVLARLPETAPAKFNVSNLTISPTQTQPHQEVKISVNVANTGGTDENYNLELKVNSISKATKKVMVAAGTSQMVNFVTSGSYTGKYQVEIAGLNGEFEVTTAPAKPFQFNWWLIGAVIVFIVILSILIVLLRRRYSSY